jgi:endonuclease YncB( thermonuclease family)
MRVQCGNRRVKVRLHCIDAPELKQAPWGREARDYLRSLVGRGPVTVRVKDKDKYRRSVGEIWKGGTNVNLKMVEASKVAVYRRHCDIAAYGRAERHTKSAHAGIWRQRGLHQRPWEYRH